jgi:hypothetical protein
VAKPKDDARQVLDRTARHYGWVVSPVAMFDRVWTAQTSKGKTIQVRLTARMSVSTVKVWSSRKLIVSLGARDAEKLHRTVVLLGSHAPRGTSNGNDRGNVYDRRKRKLALLERDGNGEFALCATCPTIVDFESATVDRHPIAGCDGGKYGPPSDLSNVRLQCERCAAKQGGHLGAARRTANAQAGRVLAPDELPGLRKLLKLGR